MKRTQSSSGRHLWPTALAVWFGVAIVGDAVAERMVDYVPPSLLVEPTSEALLVRPRDSAGLPDMEEVAKRSRPASAADRWQRFEGEFGIRQRRDSLMFDSLQTAKYQLDRTTFEMQEILLAVEDALQFDYGLDDLGLPVSTSQSARSSSGNLWLDALQGARFKSDIDLKLARESFVGVTLVLPLGD